MKKAKHSTILAPDIPDSSILTNHGISDQTTELLNVLITRFRIVLSLAKIQLKKCPSFDFEKTVKRILSLYDSGTLVNLVVMGFNIFVNQHIYGKVIISSIAFLSLFILSCLGLILFNQLKVQSTTSFTKQCRPIKGPLTSHFQEPIDVSINLSNFIPKNHFNPREIPKELQLQAIEIENTTQVSNGETEKSVERVRLVYERLNQSFFWSVYRSIMKNNHDTCMRQFKLQK